MTLLSDITSFLDQELEVELYADASLNGLQVEASEEINKIVCAVDTGLEVIEKAASHQAQLLIVHHGLFWSKPQAIRGPLKKIISLMFDAGLSLYAAHLPLDGNPQYGNNFSLARLLNLDSLERCIPEGGQFLACKGENKAMSSLSQMTETLETLPGAKQTLQSLAFGPDKPERVVILSGAGAKALESYASVGFDTFITGEARQAAYHFAKDHQLNAIFVGHYASETLGVQELGKAIQTKYNIPWEFVDIPTSI